MSKEKRIKGIKDTAKSVINRGEKALFAGIGALARIEDESRDLLGSEKSKLMDDLVGEGRRIVSRGSKNAKLDKIQDAVSDSFDKARRQVASAYDKVVDQGSHSPEVDDAGIDTVFEERVLAALEKLNYPTAGDFSKLVQRVDELIARLEQDEAGSIPSRRS
jgi:poly(hydroxyalkanoate) granule-associated protein